MKVIKDTYTPIWEWTVQYRDQLVINYFYDTEKQIWSNLRNHKIQYKVQLYCSTGKTTSNTKDFPCGAAAVEKTEATTPSKPTEPTKPTDLTETKEPEPSKPAPTVLIEPDQPVKPKTKGLSLAASAAAGAGTLFIVVS